MDFHGEIKFYGFVTGVFVFPGAVCEESCDDAFPDIRVLIVSINAEFFVIDINLYSLHDIRQLLFDIPGTSQGTNLDEILIAPLRRLIVLLPLVEHIEQSEVIATHSEESSFSIVSMHQFVFRTEKNTVSYRKHRTDCHYLIDTTELL